MSDNCVDGCIPEFYGSHCNIPCNGNCGAAECYDNGTCSNGCNAGWYGAMCDQRCNATCIDDRCDRLTGVCDACFKTNPTILCREAGMCDKLNFIYVGILRIKEKKGSL